MEPVPTGLPRKVSEYLFRQLNNLNNAINNKIVASSVPGPPGLDGSKSITLFAYKWSNSGAGSYGQATTYTWSTGGVSAYPSGWAASVGASPGAGYTLFSIQLTVTDTSTAATTNVNWSSAILNEAGYGSSMFTWVAYSNSADGTVDFTTGAWIGHAYIGQAYNKSTATESTNPADYTWTRFKGEDGTDSQGQLKALSFLRSATVPSTPAVSGSYASPVAAGWSDSIPAGTDPVYVTKRLFTSDGLPPQESSWSTPVIFTQNGTDGNKYITLAAFIWSNSGIPSYSQAVVYTWSSGNVSAYPPGWSPSAPSPPGNGYTLYAIYLGITDTISASTTVSDWSAAVASPIGYRADGTIGPQGDGARRAYIVTNSPIPPVVVAGTGDSLPSNTPSGTIYPWSYNAYNTLAAGEFQYVTDGILSAGNVTWSNAYMNYLKVGMLSALAALLGIVEIDNAGALSTSGKVYGGATPGVFLGYSGGTYKFDVGDNTKNLRWDGTNLSVSGEVINTDNLAGNAVTVIKREGYGLSTNFTNVSSYLSTYNPSSPLNVMPDDGVLNARFVCYISDVATNTGSNLIWMYVQVYVNGASVLDSDYTPLLIYPIGALRGMIHTISHEMNLNVSAGDTVQFKFVGAAEDTNKVKLTGVSANLILFKK